MAILRAFRSIIANRDIRLAETAWTLGVAAEWAWVVSLLVFAHEAGGVVAVGLVSLARTVPAAIAAPFVTTLTDRLPRERVLLGMHLARGTLVVGAVLAVVAGLPLVVYGLAVAEGILATLHRPSNASLLPGLARSPEELVGGNAVASTMEGIGVLVGPAVAGILLATGGPAAAMVLPAVSFGVGAVVVSGVRPARMRRRAASGGLGEAVAGARALRDHPAAAVLMSLLLSQTFVRGLLTVLIVSAAVGPLDLGQGGVGYLNAAIGAGGLVGALGALALVGRRRLATPFSVALGLWGAPILLMGVLPLPAVAIAMLGIVGVANAVLDVAGFSLIQRIVPNEVRGRVFGTLEGLIALTVGLGSVIAPVLVSLFGVAGALVATGVILPALALVSVPAVRRADAAAVLPEQELSLLRGVPIFRPLPMTSLEALAGALTAHHHRAGTTLIREGEVGDRFYILSTGAADVKTEGRQAPPLGPGDGFGEIALLRDVPRTATVTITDDAEVFELDRESFLDAVTGSHESRAAAEEVVVERLAR